MFSNRNVGEVESATSLKEYTKIALACLIATAHNY